MFVHICFLLAAIHLVFSGVPSEDYSIQAFINIWVKERGQCFIEEPCTVSLPQYSTERCKNEREDEIKKARYWYKLTDESQTPKTEFPIKEIPFLDQPITNVKFYYGMDKYESRYMAFLSTVSAAFGSQIIQKLITDHGNKPFNSSSDFYAMTKDLQAAMLALRVPQYFSNPALYGKITDVFSNDAWMKDDVFVQQLLVKDCPFLLKRVTSTGDVGFKLSDLQRLMNTKFSYDNAIADILNKPGITVEEAVDQNIVYIVYNPLMDGMENAEDAYKGRTGSSKMNKITSPITFLVIKDGILKLVAIQLNSSPLASVLTPSDSLDWLNAKGAVQSSHTSFCQGYYHLGRYHLVGTIFCATFRRHLGTQHPINILLKNHCEGTIPHIATGYPSLIGSDGVAAKTYGMGVEGFAKLVKDAFGDRKFGSLDLPVMLKENGLGDGKIKYFPFRDDSLVIWNEFTKFLMDFVSTYYANAKDVRDDVELQSFANEISFEGVEGPDGGKGKFVGFPRRIKTKMQLIRVLRSILWYNVLHAVLNYGNFPAFLPSSAVKLYTNQDPNNPDTFLNLGSIEQIAILTHARGFLASFRANRIMGYYDEIQDKKLRDIVWRSYKRFHGCIQKKLERRNKLRKEQGMLGMQSLEPIYLTNSIHI